MIAASRENSKCRAIIDRLIFGVTKTVHDLPSLPQYKVIADHRLESKGPTEPAYLRIRKLRHIENGTIVEIKYGPSGPRVYRLKVTMFAANDHDIPASEICALWRRFDKCRLLL